MENTILNQLDTLISEGKTAWVRLYCGLLICIVARLDETTYVGKYTPCAKNSKSYPVKSSEIKEFSTKN